MSVTLSPDELRALGYDPAASAKAGRAVKFADVPPTKRTARPYAPYRSKWEQLYAAHLDTLKMLGRVTSYAYEPDTLVCAGGTKYRPDFRVVASDGSEAYHEVKGYFRPQDKVRVREALAVSPLDVILVTRERGAWTYHRLARVA